MIRDIEYELEICMRFVTQESGKCLALSDKSVLCDVLIISEPIVEIIQHDSNSVLDLMNPQGYDVDALTNAIYDDNPLPLALAYIFSQQQQVNEYVPSDQDKLFKYMASLPENVLKMLNFRCHSNNYAMMTLADDCQQWLKKKLQSNIK